MSQAFKQTSMDQSAKSSRLLSNLGRRDEILKQNWRGIESRGLREINTVNTIKTPVAKGPHFLLFPTTG
jgi:hypothetical protein